MFDSMGKKTLIKSDEVFLLAELMLRWSFQCGEKIIINILNDKLGLYYITDKVYPPNLPDHFYILKEINISTEDARFHISRAFQYAFLKEEVLQLEKENPAYLFTGEKQSCAYWVHYCTLDNIEKIAPQLLYSLSYMHKMRLPPNEISIRASMTSNQINVTFCPDGEKSTWKIPIENLFYFRLNHPNENLNPPRVTPSEKYEFAKVEEYCQQLKDILQLDKYRVGEIILNTFPTITHIDFGKLFNPNPHITQESLKTSGKRLKIKIKEQLSLNCPPFVPPMNT